MSNKELEFIKSKGLTKEFEEFKNIQEWELKYDDTNWLTLYQNGIKVDYFGNNKTFNMYYFITLIYSMARTMRCLATKEQLFNGEKNVYCVYYDICAKEWQIAWNTDAADTSYIINTWDNAKKIADILNSSKDLKDWMEVNNEN